MYDLIAVAASVDVSARSPRMWRSSSAGERARQIRLDEPQRAAPALESDLDEDPGTLLDVVARGLHESGHLAQLRDDAPRALGFGRVRKQRLARQAASR